MWMTHVGHMATAVSPLLPAHNSHIDKNHVTRIDRNRIAHNDRNHTTHKNEPDHRILFADIHTTVYVPPTTPALCFLPMGSRNPFSR